ncbi:MAG: hypothetical protein ACREUC_16630 [Steroidobacteraceae bacterium]
MLVALVLVATTAVAAAESKPRQTQRVPDLQGVWTGATLTPLERPPQLADKARFERAEMDEQQRKATERFWAAGHIQGDVGRDNDAFLDQDLKLLADGRTSLVVDPTSGIVPLRPQAEHARDFNVSNFDNYETMGQWDRCITRDPTMFFPGVYNAAYQIVQTPSHVLISAEMIHDTRVIPLDGSPHADARIKSWSGDSRGRWEGDTLVVETTNFNGRGWIATAMGAGRLRGVPFTEQLRITERFTRVDGRTMRYEVTIDDPPIYAAPWKVMIPLTKDDQYQILEYACHEGNTGVQAIMGGARAQERAAAK